jgi:hypothetical protein
MSSLRTTVTRTLQATNIQARTIATSPILQKSVTEAVKQTAQAIDRKAADAALKGIETGEKVTETAKSAAGKTSELAGEAKGEYAGKAKGMKEEAKGKARGAAQEVEGKVKGL